MKIPIIPDHPTYFTSGPSRTLDRKAICVYSAIGFFLDDDTFFNEQKAFRPASVYRHENGERRCNTYFSWHYSPREISFKQAVEEFAHLFEKVVNERVKGMNIILPLSGGLDSRTLAAALSRDSNIVSISYEFQNGINETDYAAAIAKYLKIKNFSYTIPSGYLWRMIEEAAKINQCYAEFTHPRQLAYLDEFALLGDIFLLGHWGDVLFDNINGPDEMSFDRQVEVLLKRLVKKGGIELAASLWREWNLEGEFIDYLHERVAYLLKKINIENPNAAIRAFKSMHWAHRWTSTNIQFFSHAKPVAVPYFDDEICKFICTVPERWLQGRRIQIEYIKIKAPTLAKIPWQARKPFNLYNYGWNKMPWNSPLKAWNKTVILLNSVLGNNLVQRNWELQFVGKDNDRHLKEWLFLNQSFEGFIPKEITRDFYVKFKSQNQRDFVHPVSMLVTLSLFSKYFLR